MRNFVGNTFKKISPIMKLSAVILLTALIMNSCNVGGDLAADKSVQSGDTALTAQAVAAVPGKIEAESYSAMSGIQTETCGEGTLNVGWIEAGDWMDYTVSVETSGSYTLDLRVASTGSTGKIDFIAGTTTLASISVPSTGGWQVWTTVTTTVSLSTGDTKLRIYASGPAFNVNWFNLTLKTAQSSAISTAASSTAAVSSTAVQSSASSTIVTGNIRLDMFNGSLTVQNNAINPKFRVVNTGSASIALSGLKIRYFYTQEGTTGQTFWCDYSTAGSANVTGSFVKLLSPSATADNYLEIGFTSGAGSLMAGSSMEVQVRFSKNDWSSYNQANDYSFNSIATAYTTWNYVSALLNGSRVFGNEPTDSASSSSTPVSSVSSIISSVRSSSLSSVVSSASSLSKSSSVSSQIVSSKSSVISSSKSSIISSSSSSLTGKVVPGKIEAENYDAMSGIQTEACGEGTLDVGWIDAGDWMDYNVTVQSTGAYTVEYRVADQFTTGKIDFIVGSTTLASTPVPNTGAWQTWTTVAATVNLTAGPAKIRLYASGSPWNLNYFNITKTTVVSSSSQIVSSVSSIISSSSSKVSSSSSSVSSSASTINLGLYTQDSRIRLNSIGYLPHQDKKVSIAAAASQFILADISGNVVLTGTPVNFGGTSTGETIYIADFSSVTAAGTYVLVVPGIGKSVSFVIGNNIYNETFKTSMLGMYLWRCGTAVSATYKGQTFAHASCHTADAYDDYINGSHTIRNGQKGWHDAGDFNKYVVNAGVTVGMMFRAWEQYKSRIQLVGLTVPESGNSMPDYLDEMKWEIDWLLTMQYPDGSGKVSHKLSAPGFCGFIMPEAETGVRYFTPWGSAATADFVAMTAMASRIFRPYDAVYADKCLAAARVSYAFLAANTADHQADQNGFSTGGYGTTDPDDRLWAAAEMWETTGEAAFLLDFENRANSFSTKVDTDFDWDNVKNLGMLTYLLSARTGKNASVVNAVKSSLITAANSIVSAKNANCYGRPLGNTYYWGCNGGVARQTFVLQAANTVSPNQAYVNTALDTLSYLFGRNYYNRSFLTGVGINPPLFPHDRHSGADGIANPVPGRLVGGGWPTEKDWVDVEGSYQMNEIAVNWNAAIIYALAGFVGGEQ